MKKRFNYNERKARQDYFTNLMLINTFEAMGVLILLTLLFRAMNDVRFILYVKPSITVLMIISAIFSGFLAFLYFRGRENVLAHLSFTLFFTVIWAVMFYGFSSPYALMSFRVVCVLSVVYFIGMYIALSVISQKKPRKKS